MGNVTLSPTAPTTGAGIATLSSVGGIAAGDVDLIAPLGTIDAGEAGIRVSGNINLAALQVTNAANVQVQGKTSGISLPASINTAALSSASAATAQVSTAAQEAAQRERDDAHRSVSSIFTVRVSGNAGEGASPVVPDAQSSLAPSYERNSAFQVIGQGTLTAEERNRLTEAERRNLKN